MLHLLKMTCLILSSFRKNLKNVELAINVAAESHVDNSFGNSLNLLKLIL